MTGSLVSTATIDRGEERRRARQRLPRRRTQRRARDGWAAVLRIRRVSCPRVPRGSLPAALVRRAHPRTFPDGRAIRRQVALLRPHTVLNATTQCENDRDAVDPIEETTDSVQGHRCWAPPQAALRKNDGCDGLDGQGRDASGQ